jgi:hypothetical protein
MIKKIIGLILSIIGLLGFGFLKNYKGSSITYSTLWLFLSIVVGILGLVLIYISKSNKLSKQDKINNEKLEKLMQNGEKVFLTIKNCEIRENNYFEEANINGYSSIKQVDALFDANRNYSQNYIEKSAIIYYHKIGDTKHRMTSQTFSFSANSLRSYVENQKLVLYINKNDNNDYVFSITD